LSSLEDQSTAKLLPLDKTPFALITAMMAALILLIVDKHKKALLLRDERGCAASSFL